MELQGQAVSAHDGEKVQCMVAAPGGLLFSGGDDHMIRAWDISSLAESEELKAARYCLTEPHHAAPVRMLVAGEDCLASGDSDGNISFWNYGPVVAGAVHAEAATAEAERTAFLESMEESNQLFDCLYDTSVQSV